MAGKSHPYVEVIKIGSLIFISTVLIIIFMAAYINNRVAADPDLPVEIVEENLTPPGNVYPRQE